MKKRLVIAGVAALLLVCVVGAAVDVSRTFVPGANATTSGASDTNQTRAVQIGGHTIHAWVADTPQAREVGLGGRDSLAPDEGMLFIFPHDGVYAFWMKDMHFSIDIIWISDDLRVVDMWQDASPASYPHAYTPKGKARYVLEVQNGFTTHNTVRIGDVVSI